MISAGGSLMNAEQYGDAFKSGIGYTRRFLLSRGADSQEAEEISQDAWVRGWEHVSQLKDDRTVLTWVNTIAIRLFASEHRGPRKKFDQFDFEPTRAGIATEAHHAEIDMGKIIRLCAEREQKLLFLQLQGFTSKELCVRWGVTETTVRIRFLRARRMARERVKEHSANNRKLHQGLTP